MNIPIKIIGIATTVFWIFLILFSVSAAYSVKDLQFDFGEPQTSMTSDRLLLFSLPINIHNRGYYNIDWFNVTTRISDESGTTIAHASTFTPAIRKNERVTIFHNVTLNVTDLMQRIKSFLLNDTQLTIMESIGMRLAELIPVQGSGNFSMPWGAPLYNFRVDMPEYILLNLTHVTVTIPISFENHAFFDVAGQLQIRMFSSSDLLVGSGEATVEALQHSSYDGAVQLVVNVLSLTPSGHLEVDFQTPYFSYQMEDIQYG
jgi:hypothetical protein